MSTLKHELSSEELDFLGFRLSIKPDEPKTSGVPLDLEQVLFKVCLHLQENRFDGRLAGVLMSWMKVHGDRVHVERLSKMRLTYCKNLGRDVLWLRFFAYYNLSFKRNRWQKLTKSVLGSNADELYLGDPIVAQMLIKRWGLESFLPTNSKLKVHKGGIRVRENDILDERALMARNLQYRNRFRFGANARCDVVTHMESGQFSSTAKLSQFLGLSRAAVSGHWQDNQRFIEVTNEISSN